MGLKVGFAVGGLEGGRVGFAVGGLEGGKLGGDVGSRVGGKVGFAIGDVEGPGVGSSVTVAAVGDIDVGPTQPARGNPHWQICLENFGRQPFHEVSWRPVVVPSKAHTFDIKGPVVVCKRWLLAHSSPENSRQNSKHDFALSNLIELGVHSIVQSVSEMLIKLDQLESPS